MKTRFLFLFIFSAFSSLVFSQEEALIRKTMDYSHHIVHVSLCDEVKHVYVNMEHLTPSTDDGDISQIEFSLVDRPTTRYRAQSGPNGFEANFYNVPGDSRLEFNATFFDRDNNIIDSRVIAPKPREEGIIDVSAHLDAMLGDFQTQTRGIGEFFCGQYISEIELIAFFKEFLGLTDAEMCLMIQQYNLYFMGVSGVVNHSFVSDLCEEFTTFFDDVLNGGPGNEDDCACNMIRTNRTSLNATSIPVEVNPEDQCDDYKAYTQAFNAEFNDDDDNLIYTEGRLGVAKGSALIWKYDGGDDSPDPFLATVKPSWSQLTFRMVCVDPGTISPDLSNCSSCKKKISLEYGYYSYATIYGEKAFHISGSEFGFRSEDWAVMAVQNGGDSDILDTYGKTYVIDCGLPDDHPAISETISDASSVAGSVGDLIGNFSGGALIETGLEVIDFIDTHITSQYCDQYLSYDTIAMSGDTTYYLEPGDLFKAVIVSGGGVKGKVANNGYGFLIVNTDGYLSAVLETEADENGDVPSYCECERIGSYALASLEGTEPAVPNIWGDPNRLNFKQPSTVFDIVPRGIHNLKESVGHFLGNFGSWEPKYQSVGCCTDIYPNCMSECIYLHGCGGDPFGIQSANNGPGILDHSLHAEASDETNHFISYPNPVLVNNELFLKSPAFDIGSNIKIFNLTGQLQYATILSDSNPIVRIPTLNWKPGIYSIIWTTSNGDLLHQDKVIVID